MNDTVVTDSVKRFKWVGTRPIRPDGVPKVTGRAMYGADFTLPGMLYGKILRSPHAHARIRSIDTSKAAALPGVKAVDDRRRTSRTRNSTTSARSASRVNFWHVTRNIMAREKALYEGHAVAAVAAISKAIAEEALRADQGRLRGAAARHRRRRGDEAGRAAAVRGHDHARHRAGADRSRPTSRSGSNSRSATSRPASPRPTWSIEKEFKTAAVHQAYIEPHACVARCRRRRPGRDLVLEPGPFRRCAR